MVVSASGKRGIVVWPAVSFPNFGRISTNFDIAK
jgi:hypothetical protein